MTGSRGELALSGTDGDTDPTSIADRNVPTDTPVSRSVAARFPEMRGSAVLAVALAVLLVAFVVDIEPVILYGIGLVVFALYMWWFVSTAVAVFDRSGE